MSVNPYSVNIIGLSNKAHTFSFTLDADFFTRYGSDLVQGGTFEAQVILDKRETFIEADFTIKGEAALTCDRSLEAFGFPIAIHKKIVFKYGEEESEFSDEILVITRDTTSLDLGQLMYEFIGLQIPMKKLHPRFQEEEEENDDDQEEGKLIYTSSTEQQSGDDEDNIDPRWEQLKKLK